jgi:hypothetical protein
MISEIPTWLKIAGGAAAWFMGVMAWGWVRCGPRSREPKDPAYGLKNPPRKK